MQDPNEDLKGQNNGPTKSVLNGADDTVIIKAVINRSTDTGWMGRKVGKRQPTAIGEIMSVQQESGEAGTLYVHNLEEAARLAFPGMDEAFYQDMTPAQKASVIAQTGLPPEAFDARFFGTSVTNFKGVTPKACKGFKLSLDADIEDLSMVKLLNELYRQTGAGVAIVTYRVNATVNTMTTLTVNGKPRTSVLLSAEGLISVEAVKTGTSTGIVSSAEAAKQGAAGLADWRKNLASQSSSSRRAGSDVGSAPNTTKAATEQPEVESEAEEVMDESYI